MRASGRLPARGGHSSSRPWAAIVLVAAAACVVVALAAADVVVDGALGNLKVTVKAVNGPDGDHGLFIAPVGGTSPGLRVSLVTVPGAASIDVAPGPTELHGGCSHPIASQDVVCTAAMTSITVVGGDGRDTVAFGNYTPLASDVCAVRTPGTTPTTVRLGEGNDKFGVEELEIGSSCPSGTITTSTLLLPALTVDGGPGDDDLVGDSVPSTISGGDGNDYVGGGSADDTLNGDGGNDTVEGYSGNDVLQGGDGNDTVNGNDGNDQLVGGDGNDTVNGQFGDDVFHVLSADGSDGADTFSGGPGFDIVDYGRRTVPLTITIGDASGPDGAAGEGDNIVDAEEVIGGSSDDHIVGSAGDETLIGGDGNDSLRGGIGQDKLDGGAGDDILQTIDGVPDSVACGPGRDTAQIDLKDTLAVNQFKVGSTTVRLPDCETVIKQAVDDSAPGRPLAVQLTSGAALVRFSCPKNSKPACHGQLTLLDSRSTHRVLGRASYSLALGQTALLSVPLGSNSAALLHRRGKAVVETTEQGHSQVGPRGVRFVLALGTGQHP